MIMVLGRQHGSVPFIPRARVEGLWYIVMESLNSLGKTQAFEFWKEGLRGKSPRRKKIRFDNKLIL
jgi:hypothetical protein